MINTFEGVVTGSNSKPMLYDFTYDSDGPNQALVLFIHGFKGFKDWGHFPLIARTFAEFGYPFLKFNFSHNGTSINNPTELVDELAFGNNNISKEIEDTSLILDFISNKKLLEQLSLTTLPIVLIGHSRGGGVSVITASEDNRVKALITLASLSKYGNFFGEKRYAEWKKTGVMYVLNSRTGQQLPMYWQYMEDLEIHAEKVNIIQKAKNLTIPWLIVHGTDDESVPVSHAERLKAVNPQSEILLVKDANHTFGGKHPFEGYVLPDATTIWIDTTIKFLDKYFKRTYS